MMSEMWCRCGTVKSVSRDLCSDCRRLDYENLVDPCGMSRHEWEQHHADAQYFKNQYGGGE